MEVGEACPRCGAELTDPLDAHEGYCQQCRDWTGTTTLGMPARPRHFDFDSNPITMREWAELLEARHTAPGLVRWEVAKTRVGDAEVSTVWLGLDHNFFSSGPPLIFETMIFGGPLDQEMWRYSSAEEAEEGHRTVVELLKLEQAVHH